jgi:hypothetical protein
LIEDESGVQLPDELTDLGQIREPRAQRFDDAPGSQPYLPDDIPPDRELTTTPYDAPVRTLLADIDDKVLIVNPEFQRLSVWDRGRKSRLIESVLLNIPIPPLFFAEEKDGTRVVVDGQQRLRALEEFFRGQYRLGGLEVLPALNGKRWVDLTPRQSRIVNSRTLRCIVISANSDPDIRFEVFERLNTGGIGLNDQELRNSLYRGPFNRLLDELATSDEWLHLLKKRKTDARLQHHEMILRYFAFADRLESYRPPLKKWLNDFMSDRRNASESELDQMRADFRGALDAVKAVFDVPFRRVREITTAGIEWDNTLNRPVFELQMLGLRNETTARLHRLRPRIVQRFAELCLDENFENAISRATADRVRTRLRFELWANLLSELGVAHDLSERLPRVP